MLVYECFPGKYTARTLSVYPYLYIKVEDQRSHHLFCYFTTVYYCDMLYRLLLRCLKLCWTSLDLDMPSNICDMLSRLLLRCLKLSWTTLDLDMPSNI